MTALVAAIGMDRFRGLLTFPGHAYAVADRGELVGSPTPSTGGCWRPPPSSEAPASPSRELSVGSTPTASWTEAGPTEMRPGSYVYGDAQQVVLGAMTAAECALGLVATVVSTPAPDRAVIDAGSKALAADVRLRLLRGYGIVAGREDLVLERMSEEHGVLVAPGWSDPAAHRRPHPGHPRPLLHHRQPPSRGAHGRGGGRLVGSRRRPGLAGGGRGAGA